MPFEEVTEEILAEEARAVEEACRNDPEIRKAIEDSDREFEFRLKLARARKERKLTQKDIHETSGLAQQAISRIESDSETSPSLKSLIRYVDAIGYQLTIEPKEETTV